MWLLPSISSFFTSNTLTIEWIFNFSYFMNLLINLWKTFFPIKYSICYCFLSLEICGKSSKLFLISWCWIYAKFSHTCKTILIIWFMSFYYELIVPICHKSYSNEYHKITFAKTCSMQKFMEHSCNFFRHCIRIVTFRHE